MADSLFDEADEIGAPPKELCGFRLARVEVLNWGTFNGKVWTLDLDGRNTLLTGDIGSGKSTLVDAVTTLLVPAHRIAYNRAAGAERKERDLRSYVLGHYKAESSDTSSAARPVALRSESTLSVILGVFRDETLDKSVTVAQVFTFRHGASQPERLFVGAERALSIRGQFTGHGGDTTALRRALRSAGAELFDSFKTYGVWFRRRLALRSDQALELFHQTVSMKSVGNLTDFVRDHMLDPGDATLRIGKLLAHFDDLSEAHEAVLRAKRQMEMLQPLVEDCMRHRDADRERSDLDATRDALDVCFAAVERNLIDDELGRIASEMAKVEARRDHRKAERQRLNSRESELRIAIASSGGDRLHQIEGRVAELTKERDDRKKYADQYATLCAGVGLAVPRGPEAFIALSEEIDANRDVLSSREAELQGELSEANLVLRQAEIDRDAVAGELASLRSRTSNLDAATVALRRRLCDEVSIDPAAVPFAGELLQVRADEARWEGAIERVLRPFALSMLVPDELYEVVHRWVDQTNLRGRFVYYRVRHSGRSAAHELHRDSLVRKVDVAPDTPHAGWLARQLADRFDYACCHTPEQFRREPRALSIRGQIKGGNERHEKDDRSRIDDRTRFVLGWSNAPKIAALEADHGALDRAALEARARVRTLQDDLNKVNQQREPLAMLTMVSSFDQIDWQSSAKHISDLEDEKRRLLDASDTLAQLQAELAKLTEQVKSLDSSLETDQNNYASLGERQRERQERHDDLDEILASPDAEIHLVRSGTVAALLDQSALTLRNIEKAKRDLREELKGRIDAAGKRADRAGQAAIERMVRFCAAYPAETAEIDATLDAADEYAEMLERLRTDDLPAFEERFRQRLNDNTISEVASFQQYLHTQIDDIDDRVADINASLVEVDYNPGRYIRLEMAPTPDQEVRTFRADLRHCTEGALSAGDDQAFAEQKFIEIRNLLERFKGREGTVEADKRWTAKVTDVRNWFTFAASERWRADDAEHEHYSDSSGKSGGQKEKLAYTVLAASLAYQFGIESPTSSSFRFVVIDEAFGRGSDESARFGLQLFERLGLQLLVVTPLQKIHVIEPFVAHVGFVHNEAGKDSQLRNITIEQYRSEKAEHAASRRL